MNNLFGYVQALLFAAVFLTFINADIGWALVYVISGTALFSALCLLFSKKHFSAELRELSGTASIGEDVEFEVVLKRTGFCFIPYLELCFSAENENIHIRTSLLFSGRKTLKGTFKASHSGLNSLVFSQTVVRDFAGLFNLRIPVNKVVKKAVLPRIVEYAGPEVIPSVLPADDEDAEEGVTILSGGLPGSEHREYVPGDSPKRINYKLSAKRDRLLVRLDENAGFSSTNLFISENGQPACCEQAFALARLLIIRGGSVKITHKNETRAASTPETLGKMREWLAFREFCDQNAEPVFSPPPKDANVVFSGSGEIISVM